MFPTGAPASVRVSFSSGGNAPITNRENVPTTSANFPASGKRPHSVGKLSSSGKTSPRRRQAFQPRENVPTASANFPASGKRPHDVGKLSSSGKSTSTNGLSKTAPFPSKNRPAHRPQMPILAQKQTVTSERPGKETYSAPACCSAPSLQPPDRSTSTKPSKPAPKSRNKSNVPPSPTEATSSPTSALAPAHPMPLATRPSTVPSRRAAWKAAARWSSPPTRSTPAR